MKQVMKKALLLGLSLTLASGLALAADSSRSSMQVYSSSMSAQYYQSSSEPGSQSMVFSQFSSSSNPEGTTMQAAAYGSSDGYKGNFALLFAHQKTSGDIQGNENSDLSLTLKDHAQWNGAMNPDHKAKSASLTLDNTSTWNVTGDSYLTVLSDADQSLGNIHSKGFTVYYKADEKANQWLGGKTLTLTGGGHLMPLPAAPIKTSK